MEILQVLTNGQETEKINVNEAEYALEMDIKNIVINNMMYEFGDEPVPSGRTETDTEITYGPYYDLSFPMYDYVNPVTGETFKRDGMLLSGDFGTWNEENISTQRGWYQNHYGIPNLYSGGKRHKIRITTHRDTGDTTTEYYIQPFFTQMDSYKKYKQAFITMQSEVDNNYLYGPPFMINQKTGEPYSYCNYLSNSTSPISQSGAIGFFLSGLYTKEIFGSLKLITDISKYISEEKGNHDCYIDKNLALHIKKT